MLGILTVVMLVGSLMVAIGVHHTKVYVKKHNCNDFPKNEIYFATKKITIFGCSKAEGCLKTMCIVLYCTGSPNTYTVSLKTFHTLHGFQKF